MKAIAITEKPQRVELQLIQLIDGGGAAVLASVTGKTVVVALRKLATAYQAKLDAAELAESRTIVP